MSVSLMGSAAVSFDGPDHASVKVMSGPSQMPSPPFAMSVQRLLQLTKRSLRIARPKNCSKIGSTGPMSAVSRISPERTAVSALGVPSIGPAMLTCDSMCLSTQFLSPFWEFLVTHCRK
jgi:hypothetical protein